MIDTDKYEGHTPVREEWPRWCEDWLFNLYSGKTDDGSHTPNWNQDNNLACDAPDLLAEVKRLREGIEQALEAMSSHTNHSVYNSSWNILKELIE